MCPDCSNPLTCGGSGVPNQCGLGTCEPLTCVDQNAECGLVLDGCEMSLNCGDCDDGETCGANGVPNQCGCQLETCDALGFSCGIVDDGCGGTMDCGTCPEP